MAIDHPGVVRFCNERLRPICDRYVRLMRDVILALDMYDANGYGAALGTDDAEVIADGADQDGRPRLTVGQVRAIIAAAQSLRQAAESSDSQLYRRFLAAAVNVGVSG